MASNDRTVTVDSDPAPSNEPGLESGSLFAGRYEVLATLGSGGFGRVYKVFDRFLRREVALKLLRVEKAEGTALRRLRREAALARDVAAPNVARIFDVGEAEGRHFLTLELLGESLRALLRSRRLATGEALRIGGEILAGLDALHGAGIVHRDVKPGNILFDAEGRAKLADLGLAFPVGRDETRTMDVGSLVGTAEYISPEQALGRTLDARSDLFAAGLVFFEMLAGEPPYPTAGAIDAVLVRITRRATRLRTLSPRLPRWLDRFVARLLERNPDRRYQSAAAALADLRRQRVPRLAARLRALAIVCALGAAVAIATGVYSSWLGHRYAGLRPIQGADDAGIEAVDHRGRVLWRLTGVATAAARIGVVARIVRGAPERLLVPLRRATDYRPESAGFLTVLDPQTGRRLGRIDMRHGRNDRSLDPPVVDRFAGAGIWALDLDGDGLDEVLESFVSMASWPSYTTLYEPATGRTRTVFVGAGHHIFSGAQDLDDDGRPELLFAGINDVLGRYAAVAAVKLDPWIAERRDVQGESLAGDLSPGLDRMVNERTRPLWYRLLPRGRFSYYGGNALQIDPTSRTIAFGYEDRSPARLDFEGRSLGAQGGVAANAANTFRIYTDLEDAIRRSRRGAAAEALAPATEAVELSREIGDATLVECSERIEASCLVRDGKVAAAEAIFSRLAVADEAASEIDWTAARAFDLAGNLDRAALWYRRALDDEHEDSGMSRGALFPFQGEVFDLVELGRWREAMQAVDRYAAVYPNDVAATVFRNFVLWRSGKPVGTETLRVHSNDWETTRYLALELARLRGVAVPELLPEVELELSLAGATKGAVESLRAELLAASGHREAALVDARSGVDLLRAAALIEPTARALLPIAVERLARLGGSETADRAP